MIEFNGTFLVAMISFVMFIIIMNVIFYNPILSIIKKREDYISSNYADSKSNNDGAQDLKDKYEYEYEQAKIVARKKMNEEIDNVQKLADEKAHNARVQAKQEIQSKKDILSVEKNDLLNQVNTSELTDMIVNKVLKKS